MSDEQRYLAQESQASTLSEDLASEEEDEEGDVDYPGRWGRGGAVPLTREFLISAHTTSLMPEMPTLAKRGGVTAGQYGRCIQLSTSFTKSRIESYKARFSLGDAMLNKLMNLLTVLAHDVVVPPLCLNVGPHIYASQSAMLIFPVSI